MTDEPPTAAPEPPGHYQQQQDGSWLFIPDDAEAFERMVRDAQDLELRRASQG